MFGAGGPPDEVVRILWINEFEDRAKGLVGATRRASAEYRKAASEQKKLDTVGIASAKKAAEAAERRQQAQKDQLTEYQRLIFQESNITKRGIKALQDADKVREQLAHKEETRQKKVSEVRRKADEQEARLERASNKDRDRQLRESNKILEDETNRHEKEVEKIEKDAQRQRNQSLITYNNEKKEIEEEAVRRRHARQDIENKDARRQREIFDAGELRAIRDAASKRRGDRDKETTREKNERIAASRELLDAVAKIESAKQREITKNSKDALDEQVADVRRAEAEKVAAIKDSDRARVSALQERLRMLEETHRGTDRELAQLRDLRAEFGDFEHLLRRVRADKKELGVERAFRAVNQEAIRSEAALKVFQRNVQRVRNESVEFGRVSESSWRRFTESIDRGGITTEEFKDATRNAGIEIRNFSNEKTRELRILRQNTSQLKEHNRAQKIAVGSWRGLKQAVFLSTNEMILFSRTVQILVIPAVTAFIGVIIQGFAAAGAAVVGLTAALAPLVGVIGAIPSGIASIVQGLSVWKIAMTNLGKSANNFSKIVKVSLTGSTEDFNKLVSQLPEFAKRFANVLRTEVLPGFEVLRAQIQENIFGAITRAVQRLVPAFRPLRAAFVDTSVVFQQLIDTLSMEFASPRWVKDLNDQMNATNVRFRDLIPAIVRFARAFINLSRAADPLVDHLVVLTNRFAKWLDLVTSAGRASGTLSGFFVKTNEALDQTGKLLGGVGEGLLNIGKIAYRVIGRQLLRDLANASQGFADWTESPHGMRAIAKFFRDVKPAVYEFGRLIRDVVKAMLDVGDEPAFIDLLKQIRTEVLPAFTEALRVASKEFAPAFIDFLTAFAKALAAIGREGGGLTILVRAFKIVADAVRFFAESPLGKPFFTFLGFIAVFRTARFGAAVTGLATLTKLLTAVGAAALRGAVGYTAFNRILSRTPLVQRAIPSVITSANLGRQAIVPTPSIFGSFRDSGFRGGFAQFRANRAERLARQRAAIQGASTGIIPGMTGSMLGPTTRTPFLRSRGFQQAGRVVGGAGLAAGAASAFGLGPGGGVGTVLGGIGAGAAIGSFFPGLGTAVGAVVGGLGGLALAVRHSRDGMESFADAAKRRARDLGSLTQSRRDLLARLPQARLDLGSARVDFRAARDQRIALQRQGVTGPALDRAKIDEKQALANLSRAARLVAEIRQRVELANRQIELASVKAADGIRGTLKDAAFKMRTLLVGSKPWNEELKKTKERLQGIADSTSDINTKKAVQEIIDLITKLNAIPSKKRVEIELRQTILPPTTSNERESGGTSRGTPVTELGLTPAQLKALGVNVAPAKPSKRGPKPPDFGAIEAAAAAAADALQTRVDDMTTSFTQSLQRQSIDPNSIRGIKALAAFEKNVIKPILEQRLAKLNEQLAAAIKAGDDPETIKSIKGAISQTTQAIGQISADAVTHANDIAMQRSQNFQDAATNIATHLDIRRDRFARGLTRRRIDPDSIRGLREQNVFDKKVVGPALREQVAQMRLALSSAIKAHADPQTIQQINDAIGSLINEIAQIPVTLLERQRAIVAKRREEIMAGKAFRVGKAEQLFERLGLKQQIAGTFDTAAAAEQRKRFVQKNVIPELRSQLREERKPVKGETRQERFDRLLRANEIQNHILELIAQYTQDTAKNTTPQLKGQLAFGFGGQITTDVQAGQVGA